ncbi:hypothetical protein [Gracilimonas sp.]|uniref:hypothetical protein n=1 Tax=Gracilimonas sp. TaxID=1974203 RepID=UPI0032ED35BA
MRLNKTTGVLITTLCLLMPGSYFVKAQNSINSIENESVAAVIQNAFDKNAEMAEKLIEVYHATKRFQDVEVALKEGYVRDPFNICDTGPMMGWPEFTGAMGVHYVRPDLLGLVPGTERVDGNGLHTDFNNPAILIYEPMEDGSMKLVAIENLVFQKGWHDAGNEARPDFMGIDYFSMVDNPETEPDEAHKFEPHYDLHMWLYKENEHGLFMPFNPSVSCEYHVDD